MKYHICYFKVEIKSVQELKMTPQEARNSLFPLQ